ncbi:hypothetical protein HFD88_007886 [Aspergillus terreus]|nr:hypothetical protein HFD88_007886 [Aspergillus terreus]
MVVYLFRLDANERAEKFLALTVSHAHHLGFHRSKVVLQMSAFNDEMVRRLWWCLHAMDRRMSIETGHPSIIQDVNVDTPQPRDLSDDWLTRYKNDPRTSAELDSEIHSELSNNECITPIPYLIATIRYSRVLGKIWETIYGANVTETSPTPTLLQYLEHLVHGAQKEISPDFSTNQLGGSANRLPNYCPWWRTKQQMLMRIRWLSLRLLIRKSILHQRHRPPETRLDILDNEITCIQTACQIIREFKQVADENTISAYPFLHSLVAATLVSLGIIIKEPSFRDDYGEITLHAAKSLERYCHRTWVSGRMLRAICRLNQIASRVLCSNEPPAIRRVADDQAREVASTSSYPSTLNLGKGPSNGVTTVCSNAVTPQPAAGNPVITGSNTTNGVNEAPSLSLSALADPSQLVMTDFDFEQSFINDVAPLCQPYGCPDTFSDMQPGAPTSTEMDWLESLLGGE